MFSGKTLNRRYARSLSCSYVFFRRRMDDGSQRMYYTGQGPNGSTAIGVAKLPVSTSEWVREQASIVFADA